MESYFFRVLPSAFLLTQSNPRRALKSAQEQEDRQQGRNKGAAETAEQRGERLKKRQERDHAQIVSERQATSQWKNTGERVVSRSQTLAGRESLVNCLYKTCSNTYPNWGG